MKLLEHRASLVTSSQTLALALLQPLDGRLAVQTMDLPSVGLYYLLTFSVPFYCSP